MNTSNPTAKTAIVFALVLAAMLAWAGSHGILGAAQYSAEQAATLFMQ